MVTPNFFEFASDERSQDAFICWLLSWAKPEMKEKNVPLHETGRDFVRSLAERHGYAPPDLGAVERVHYQYKQADVVARLGGSTALLIEDKVGTGAHSGQLGRYRSALQEEFDEVLPIFLKTRDQSDYEHAREEGYEPFLREDLLEVLQRGGGDSGVGNDIFHDYLSHLRFIQDTVESFENKPVGQWPEAAWKGFYQLLQDELGEGSWNYVANPSGGFMAFYWHSFGSGGSEQYLQLEEEKLCFKISVDEEGRYSELRDKWHSRVVEAGEEAFVQVRKPDHFGHGGHMTVAVLEGGYLKTDEDGLIDIDKTVARLRKAEEILTRAAADG